MKIIADKHLKTVFQKWDLQTMESAAGETDETQKLVCKLLTVYKQRNTWKTGVDYLGTFWITGVPIQTVRPLWKCYLKKKVIPYSGQLRKARLSRMLAFVQKRGKKKELLKDWTEAPLAAAEVTDAGGHFRHCICAMFFLYQHFLKIRRGVWNLFLPIGSVCFEIGVFHTVRQAQ